MSQSAFSAVLVGVTALLRRPSLLRGRGCGFCTLASAASRSDLAARGFGLRCPGFGLRYSWFRLRCSWFRLPPLLAPTSAACRVEFSASRFGFVARASVATDCRTGFAASRFGFVARASVATDCRTGFAASRFGFVAHGFDFAARGFGFRRFSLRLGCSWLRLGCLPRFGLAARASASAACRAEFAAYGFALAAPGFAFAACCAEFAALGFDFVAHGFGCHGLLRWVRCFSLRLGCPGFDLRRLPR